MRAKRIKNELSFHAEQLTIETLSWRYCGNEFDNRGGVETIILTVLSFPSSIVVLHSALDTLPA